ncbi:MAG: GNAT family N-acetyltransferase [Acidobacteria bacterium]|nr:GNAT family N-acetyltransferase [Acidobacteriota bacterium]
MRPAIAVFAKAPIAGRVKTRLAVSVGPETAARLYESMVARLLDRLIGAGLAADIELHTDISTDAWKSFNVTRRLQVEGNLGDRMRSALSLKLAEGRPRAMILGGDVPTVPISHLEKLLALDADVALGPADDGGYYAIACRRTTEKMFDGVAWSTASALSDTKAACERAGLTVALGESWFDIDTPEDLARWPQVTVAEESDAAEIVAVRSAAANRLTHDFGKGHWSSCPTENGVLRQIRTERVLIARNGDRILGTLVLATKKPWAIDVAYFTFVPKAIYLHSMAVAPDAQRRGIGRILLEEARQIARAWPAQSIRLDAYDAAAGAVEFYAKCGFRETGRVVYRGTPLVYFESVFTPLGKPPE